MLGLDLTVDNSMLRFYYGTAPLLFMDEIVSKLNAMVTELIEARDLAAQRADEQTKRADTLELEVESLRAELEPLRKKP